VVNQPIDDSLFRLPGGIDMLDPNI